MIEDLVENYMEDHLVNADQLISYDAQEIINVFIITEGKEVVLTDYNGQTSQHGLS